MLVSQLAPAVGYPHVQGFLVNVLDMQFNDARAMLQLPRPELGIDAGCNFALASWLCNLISGVSTTIFKPADLLHEDESGCRSGDAFKGLVKCFFPYSPAGTTDFAKDLYDYCRNPLSHSIGIKHAATPTVLLSRVMDPEHPNQGWLDKELTDLERGPYHHTLKGVVANGSEWTLHLDPFYFDVVEMLRRLTRNPAQMGAAEGRFSRGVVNWRKEPQRGSKRKTPRK